MPGFGEFLKNNRTELVVGGAAAMVAGSLVMVRKGEKKRAEDFAAEGLVEHTKGDAHPHPATDVSVEQVLGLSATPSIS